MCRTPPVLSRRLLVAGALVSTSRFPLPVRAQTRSAVPSLPIGWSDQPPGLGFRIGHGFQTENTWYLPGYWHCAEDWYAIDGETAGAQVYAMTDGEVVFVGSDYPGRVVIVRHEDGIYSMYGHLDYATAVVEGDSVSAGDVLGTVLMRTDGAAPSHVHVEVRTFLTTLEVNGDAPRYGFNCGMNCAPGPGYWPIDAPDLPVDMGWRNPTHVYGSLLRNALDNGPDDIRLVVTADQVPTFDERDDYRQATDVLIGTEGTLVAVDVADPDSPTTSAEGTELWLQLSVDGEYPVWIAAAVPSADETGSDGRPSSIRVPIVVIR